MLGRSSSGKIYSSTPIGEAIANGAGLYANEIQNARDAMEREYGSIVSRANLAIAEMSAGALGMSEQAMKDAEKTGFHPKIGKKTGAEVVTAHEMGHFLAQQAMNKAKLTERQIVERASKKIGVKVNNMASQISEYARYNYAETIAEASADVFANGRRASKASRAIMSEIKSILK